MQRDSGSDFDSTYRRHYRAIFAFILGMTGDVAAAEDLTQDVFAAYARDGSQIDAPAPWLYRTAKNRLLDYRRKTVYDRRKREKIAQNADPPGGDTAIDAETASRLRGAVAKLPEDLREAVVLYYFEDMKPPEIAALLSKPESTVRVNVHRGLKKLAEIARRMGIDEVS